MLLRFEAALSPLSNMWQSKLTLLLFLSIVCCVCSQEIVASQAEANYAILSTRVRLYDMEDTEAGSNYELWGNFRVQFDEYIMARTNVGSPSRHMICPKENVGGPRDWFGDLAQAGIAVGAGIATGGSATAVIAAGAAISVVSQLTSNAQQGPSNCESGYIATASYPVSLGANTLWYNYVLDLREDDFGDDDVWQLYTKDKENWSDIDVCWGQMFDPSQTIVRKCVYNTDMCYTPDCLSESESVPQYSTRIGTVSLETAILAWVRGPLVDGEVQDFDGNGNTIVTRESFYGPSYGVHVSEN